MLWFWLYFLAGTIFFCLLYDKTYKRIKNSEDWESKYLRERIVNECVQQDYWYNKIQEDYRRTNIAVKEWNANHPKDKIDNMLKPREFANIARQALERDHYTRTFLEQSTRKPNNLSED